MVQQDENSPGNSSEDNNVQIDDEEISESSVKSNQKVELDLDDAPFLEWEEDSGEEEGAGEGQKEVVQGEKEAEEEDKKSKKSVFELIKKWWWVGASALGLLLIIAASLYITSAVDTKDKEGTDKEESTVVELEESEKSKTNQTKQMQQVSLEPFWVVYDTKDNFRQFHLGIDLSIKGKDPAWELEKKIPVIRDSLYYFLKNKQIQEISDKDNISELKKEIQTVVNNNLSNGKVDKVLIQKYLVE